MARGIPMVTPIITKLVLNLSLETSLVLLSDDAAAVLSAEIVMVLVAVMSVFIDVGQARELVSVETPRLDFWASWRRSAPLGRVKFDVKQVLGSQDQRSGKQDASWDPPPRFTKIEVGKLESHNHFLLLFQNECLLCWQCCGHCGDFHDESVHEPRDSTMSTMQYPFERQYESAPQHAESVPFWHGVSVAMVLSGV